MALVFLPIPFIVGLVLRTPRRAIVGGVVIWALGASALLFLAATGENVGALIWGLLGIALPVSALLARGGAAVRARGDRAA